MKHSNHLFFLVMLFVLTGCLSIDSSAKIPDQIGTKTVNEPTISSNLQKPTLTETSKPSPSVTRPVSSTPTVTSTSSLLILPSMTLDVMPPPGMDSSIRQHCNIPSVQTVFNGTLNGGLIVYTPLRFTGSTQDVHMLDLATGRMAPWTFQVDGAPVYPETGRISPDGLWFLYFTTTLSGRSQIHLRSVEGEEYPVPDWDGLWPAGASWFDSRRIIVKSKGSDAAGNRILLDVFSGTWQELPFDHEKYVLSIDLPQVVYDQTLRYMFYTSGDNTLTLIDTKTGKQLWQSFDVDIMRSPISSPQRDRVAIITNHGSGLLLMKADGQILYQIDPRDDYPSADFFSYDRLSWSPDGRYLAFLMEAGSKDDRNVIYQTLIVVDTSAWRTDDHCIFAVSDLVWLRDSSAVIAMAPTDYQEYFRSSYMYPWDHSQVVLIDIATGEKHLVASDVNIAGLISGDISNVVMKTSTPQLVDTPSAMETPLLPPVGTFNPQQTPTAIPLQTRLLSVDGMVQSLIPAGWFQMGSDLDKYGETIHPVYLDSYWIDQTEVTNAMYALCVAAKVCVPPTNRHSDMGIYYSNPEYASYPVVDVSWYQAAEYCEWAGRRLPTEAEWEKAARGGLTGKKYPWGDQIDANNLLNYCDRNCTLGFGIPDQHINDGFQFTAPAGSYLPNGFGLFDIAGNVWEWVSDWRGDYPGEAVYNPTGPTLGDLRVFRGGSYTDSANLVTAFVRAGGKPEDAIGNLGFRCVSSP